MQEPKALGMVLAMVVDPRGKPVRDGSAKGQLYASADELAVVRPKPAAELFDRIAAGLLVGSALVVVVNLFAWKSQGVIWLALAAQAVYWLSLPVRRRGMEPKPLTAAELDAARGAGRVAIRVPSKAILRAVPPEPPRAGFRKPARFELPDGALEIYLSEDQFRAAAAALGRSP
ncbi:MAG TPA: hypothetical protein VFL83_12800 [Anaeromyxobacter sp.]|nr:hypothetical protein [Anaeromyxobacter sp.]